jgi:hypothetical protein
MIRPLRLLLLLAALSIALPAHAGPGDGSQRFGDYLIHANALPTLALGADMARQYSITRSDRRGMLNVSVQKVAADGSTSAVAADISGVATGLSGHASPIEMREIPGEYVSYIGLFDVSPPDTYTFKLSIKPVDSERAYELRFSHGFVAE